MKGGNGSLPEWYDEDEVESVFELERIDAIQKPIDSSSRYNDDDFFLEFAETKDDDEEAKFLNAVYQAIRRDGQLYYRTTTKLALICNDAITDMMDPVRARFPYAPLDKPPRFKTLWLDLREFRREHPALYWTSVTLGSASIVIGLANGPIFWSGSTEFIDETKSHPTVIRLFNDWPLHYIKGFSKSVVLPASRFLLPFSGAFANIILTMFSGISTTKKIILYVLTMQLLKNIQKVADANTPIERYQAKANCRTLVHRILLAGGAILLIAFLAAEAYLSSLLFSLLCDTIVLGVLTIPKNVNVWLTRLSMTVVNVKGEAEFSLGVPSQLRRFQRYFVKCCKFNTKAKHRQIRADDAIEKLFSAAMATASRRLEYACSKSINKYDAKSCCRGLFKIEPGIELPQSLITFVQTSYTNSTQDYDLQLKRAFKLLELLNAESPTMPLTPSEKSRLFKLSRLFFIHTGGLSIIVTYGVHMFIHDVFESEAGKVLTTLKVIAALAPQVLLSYIFGYIVPNRLAGDGPLPSRIFKSWFYGIMAIPTLTALLSPFTAWGALISATSILVTNHKVSQLGSDLINSLVGFIVANPGTVVFNFAGSLYMTDDLLDAIGPYISKNPNTRITITAYKGLRKFTFNLDSSLSIEEKLAFVVLLMKHRSTKNAYITEKTVGENPVDLLRYACKVYGYGTKIRAAAEEATDFDDDLELEDTLRFNSRRRSSRSQGCKSILSKFFCCSGRKKQPTEEGIDLLSSREYGLTRVASSIQ